MIAIAAAFLFGCVVGSVFGVLAWHFFSHWKNDLGW